MDDEPPLVDSSPVRDAMNAPTTRTTLPQQAGSLDPADPGPGRSLAMQLCVSSRPARIHTSGIVAFHGRSSIHETGDQPYTAEGEFKLQAEGFLYINQGPLK